METQVPKSTNVQVAVRCRPMSSDERKAGQPSVVTCEQAEKKIHVSYGPAGKKTMKSFNFDKVFGMYSTQEEVFEQMVRPIVDETLEGFNCTIFAYGQTGTGKTHTMEGDIHSEEHAGIVPRSVKAILEQLEASGVEFTIRVSFLELYNEELQDLLNTSGEKKLKLCEDVKKGVVCQNLEEITVLSANDIFEILKRGIQQRQTAETLCNKNSSRSHSIFTMKIMIKESNFDGEEVVRHGQLNLVDLAGSECIGRSGAKNDRAREAGSINQSLLTLGRVITALVEHHGHIPYRDSKLTRLLQESLGGKAKTCIIATLSPSQLAMEESLSTLDYAHRAKNIKNQPTINQKMTKKVLLKEYGAEIEHLKTQLQLTREKNGIYIEPNEFYSMEARLASQENQITECESALRLRNEETKQLRSENSDLLSELEQFKEQLNRVNCELTETKLLYATTDSKLKWTEAELFASNAVVTEQTKTETILRRQGFDLQEEVISRRSDVDKLMTKIDCFMESETRRETATQRALSKIEVMKHNMDEKSKEFQTSNETKSKKLTNAIGNLLSESESTCQVLQTAIGNALDILIGDSTIAKDHMTSSCNQLSNHLTSMNQRVAVTLLDVQQSLSQWLQQVDTAMKETKNHLSEQETHLQLLSSGLSDAAKDICTQSTSAILAQNQSAKLTIAVIQSMKNELLTQLKIFQDGQAQMHEKAANELEEQMSVMEQSFNAMLQKMKQHSLQSYQKAYGMSTELCSNIETTQVQASEGLEKMINAQVQEHVQTISTTMLTFQGHQQSLVSSISMASEDRLKSNASLEQVSGSVTSQQKILEDCVSMVVKDVDVTIRKGCDIVSETSLAANKILEDVTNATSKMNEQTSLSLTKFTTFLEGSGKELSNDLVEHFGDVHGHLVAQSNSLQNLDESMESISQAIQQNKIVSSGATPRKQKFSSLPELVVTRDHDIIRSEAKSAVGEEPRIDSAPNASNVDTTYPTTNEDESGSEASQMNQENIAPNTINKAKRDVVRKDSMLVQKGKTLKKRGSGDSKASEDIEKGQDFP